MSKLHGQSPAVRRSMPLQSIVGGQLALALAILCYSCAGGHSLTSDGSGMSVIKDHILQMFTAHSTSPELAKNICSHWLHMS